MQSHDVVATVNLARAYNLTSILPVALFECCQLPRGEFIDPVRYGEGADDSEQLSSADIRLCLRARDTLTERSHWLRWLLLDDDKWDDAEEPCQAPVECRLSRSEIVCTLATLAPPTPFHSTNPLARIDDDVDAVISSSGFHLCDSCVHIYRTLHAAQRKAVWDGLGKVFGVEGWPQ